MKKNTVLLLAVLVTVTAANAQLSGSGTEQNPYLISSVNDLKFLRDQVNLTTNTNELNTSVYQQAGKVFRLTTDLDLASEDWTPIGIANTAFRSFRGLFDGNGHKILNLKIGSISSRATFVQAGLFAYCTNNAVLKNLTVENAAVYNGTVASLNQTAILVANANLTTIHNCHVSGVADCLHTSKGVQVGGIVANGTDLTLINSSANVTVNAESTVNTGTQIAVNSGGLVSVLAVSATGSIVKNCFSNGSIIATSAMPSGAGNFVYAGGIVANSAAGNTTYQNKIINCYSACNLNSTSSGTVTSYAGGIAGSNGNYNTLSNCIALNSTITFSSGGTTKSANRITGNNAATSTVLADNYASEGMTITAYTPTSNITGKDGANLGVNVPATLLNSILTNPAAVTKGTDIYLFKPWITSFDQPVFGSGLEVNVSNIDDCPGCNVIIPSEASLNVNATRTYTSIKLSAGAKLTIQSGNTLTSPVTIESSATGTGTLVDENTAPTINATVNQYLPTGRNWYVGIPLNATPSYTTLTAAGATSVSYWDETNGVWVDNYTGTLSRGKGYIAVSNSGTATNNISFTGTLNAGDIDIPLTRTAGKTKEGFNLISNPYPSYLNAMTAINSKSANMETTIWYRTKGAVYSFETVNTTSGVGTNNVTGYIPPMQAFWVRVKPNTNPTLNNSETLTFTNAMRYHANPTIGETTITTTPLKAPKMEQNKLAQLNISSVAGTDQAVLYFNDAAANGYDNYDSRKMFESAAATIPEIYMLADAEKVAINGLQAVPYETELPLGIITKQTGTYTISVGELSNFEIGTRLYLIDKQQPTTQFELTPETMYSFNASAIETTDRFSLLFRTTGSSTGINNAENVKANVYVNAANQIVINAPVKSNYAIYNAMGQLIDNGVLKTELQTVNCKLQTGIFVVKVGNESKKVLIK